MLAIRSIYDRLTKLVGDTIESHGSDQERNRGIGLQRLVCPILGLKEYADKGQFPDVLSQALEVKLQTSPTIDLGLVSPDGTEPAQEVGPGIRHCDVRYAVFYGRYKERDTVELSGVVVTTGQDFFGEFDKFGGKVINAKLQIPLPRNFFD